MKKKAKKRATVTKRPTKMFVWTTSELVKLRVADMKDDHVENAAYVCETRLVDKRPWHNLGYFRRALTALRAEQVLRERIRAALPQALNKVTKKTGAELTPQRLGSGFAF